MSAPLAVACPTCQTGMKLPATLVGKRIRCKKCETVFVVSASAEEPPPFKPGDAPIGFKDDPPPPPPPADDDDDNPYGVTKDDLDVPRCPFCVKELDPPDTKVCLNCGYDLMKRLRHATVNTIDYSAADWILHLGPGVLAAIAVVILLVFNYFVQTNMREWMTGGLLDAGEKDKVTGKDTFYISPYCFNVWIGVVSAFLTYLAGKFAYRRLVLNWKPAEKVVVDKGD